jgi:hypothetical protein
MSELAVFRNRRRIEQVARDVEPRYARRLADQIATSFYEACRIGNLDAAQHLMQALEWEVARSTTLLQTDGREDGDEVAAVRARYDREVRQRDKPPGPDYSVQRSET